jgi:iron complex outermembrane recepter protein
LGYSANAAALYYFGAASYGALSTQQQTQLSDALAIRKAQIGVLWAPVNAQALSETLPSWVLSPSYKINGDQTAYVSWQHGAKAGISQVTNGINTPALPEKTNAFELGLKSALLNKELTVNADLFLQNITDYQQAVSIYDAYTTALNNNGLLYYASATGNAPKVRTEGLEVDSSYTGIRHTTIRFDGALIRAYYRQFPNSPQPVEDGNLKAPYRDVSGQQLPGAAHLTANLGLDSWTALPRDLQLHGSANVAYEGRSNSDTALSAYAWTPANTLTDFSVGVRTAKPSFDVSLLVKNIFNDTAHLTQTWNTYTPAVPRWIGVMFTGKI